MTSDAASLMTTSFEAVASRDVDAIAALWHPEIEERFLALGQTLDAAGARAFFTELFAAFDPFEFTPRRILDAGTSNGRATSVGEWTIRGRFVGARWQGFEATGGWVEMQGVDVMEWQDSLLRVNTVYMDGAALARQLGLLPPAGSLLEQGMTGVFNAVQRLRGLARR